MEKAYLLLLNGLATESRLSDNSRLRLEKLMAVWDHVSYIILSTGYTRHKPPFLDEWGYPITESRVAANTLLDQGVDRAKILIEELSSDTIGNIYFTMLLIAQPLELRSISIVTSSFHMARARNAAEWLCSLSGWQHIPALSFETAPDADLPEDLKELVWCKEKEGLRNIIKLRRSIRSVSDMCLWLQREHKNYNLDERTDFLSPELLPLY